MMSSSDKADLNNTTDTLTETSDSINEEAKLAAEINLLEAENERLRERVAEAHRSRYRETAIALCITGILFGLLGLIMQTMSTVLFALSGIGVFSGILTYFLTPEQFIAADVGQQVYAASAESLKRICADLGLSDRRVYVTTRNAVGETGTTSWLFIPESNKTPVPAPTDFETGFIIEDGARGLSVRPTGSGLFTAFERSLTESLGTTPDTLCAQLSNAVIEDFELADKADFDTDSNDGRASVQLTDVVYDDSNQFDQPVVSLFAVGLSAGLNTQVEATVTEMNPLSVTFRWDTNTDDN